MINIYDLDHSCDILDIDTSLSSVSISELDQDYGAISTRFSFDPGAASTRKLFVIVYDGNMELRSVDEYDVVGASLDIPIYPPYGLEQDITIAAHWHNGINRSQWSYETIHSYGGITPPPHEGNYLLWHVFDGSINSIMVDETYTLGVEDA